MKPPNWNWIIGVLAALILAVLITGGIKMQNASRDAKNEQTRQQQEREHNENVQFYLDNCVVNGSWVCPVPK